MLAVMSLNNILLLIMLAVFSTFCAAQVSPDGRNVYAAATRSASVASFRRDPESGKLTCRATIPDCAEGGPNGAAGIDISPDSQFVYVATEDKSVISIFERALGK